MGCHGLVTAKNEQALRTLRKTLTPPELSYIISRKGEWWLEKHYP